MDSPPAVNSSPRSNQQQPAETNYSLFRPSYNWNVELREVVPHATTTASQATPNQTPRHAIRTAIRATVTAIRAIMTAIHAIITAICKKVSNWSNQTVNCCKNNVKFLLFLVMGYTLATVLIVAGVMFSKQSSNQSSWVAKYVVLSGEAGGDKVGK
ncbi:uncharacterized protein BDZ99DRAFT_518080 [Mytilinidion resinicola]|uniref:Uncharacterized protein n=1 Tax=Mytilinidion resinicola TaxID=574789 RepID=A0A6A6YW65_9PEZI|nr:uncharacterized protein BDZ99DRAFT_518080 [Mytilinidion resinicola]KAF2812225.1 hypothetical protein BDZ99DRAFT_518080 [Mytilinidion resinicola]